MLKTRLLVKLLLILQTLGFALIVYHEGSRLGAFAYLYGYTSELVAQALEYATIVAMIVIAVLSIWRVRLIPTLLLSVLFFSEAIFSTVMGGKFARELIIMAHAARFTWPVCAWFLVSRKIPFKFKGTSLLVLRLSLASTFIAHGIEALMKHPKFIDLVIVASHRILNFRLSESLAQSSLVLIGLVDLLLAALVLFKRSKPILYYMSFWGLVTASSRIVYGGWLGVPDMMIRCAHWGVPIILISEHLRKKP